MKKYLLSFAFILTVVWAFSQSKKEQIEILTKRVDSLNTILVTARDNAAEEIESFKRIIDGLNSNIAQLNSDVSSLESSVSILEEGKSKITRQNEKFKIDLEEMMKKNLELESTVDALTNTDDDLGFDGNIQSVKGFTKNYKSIHAWNLSFLKFQKYPIPNSKQDILEWLKQFEVSSKTNVVYDYDIDPEDWKGVTGMLLTYYKNGIILHKIMGYESITIRIEFPFLSVNDAKLLFKQLILSELASGCLEEYDLKVKFKYSQEIMGTIVHFGNGC